MSGVLVVTDHTRGRFSALSTEMLGLAAQLRGAGHAPVRVLVIGSRMGPACEALSLAGVDEIIEVPDDAAEFDAALYEAAVVQAALAYQPEVILIGHSANGMAYAAGVAVGLGAGFAADVFEVSVRDAAWAGVRSGYGNKLNVNLGFADKCVTVFTVRGGCYTAPAQTRQVPRATLSLTGTAIAGHWIHEQFIDPPEEGVDVSKSEFILSIGRGVQDEKNVPRFVALADRLGATLGCSRPVADSGWLPKSRQIGLTGKPAAGCSLYLALGISGAVQHLWGMKHVDTIIAVNTDGNAPIFSVATYGVVMDLFAFTEALEQQLTARNPG